MKTDKTLSPEHRETLLAQLEKRFLKNPARHPGILWTDVRARLETQPEKLWSLDLMEETGGEPDVVGLEPETNAYLFYDCSPESPSGRRSLCYDRQALDSRKEFKPTNSALDLAFEMGIDLLDEAEYRRLQQLGTFDTKTSSWIMTPPDIRKLGGAVFCEYRYGHVFVFHNGASSYYAARGFRGVLKV